jgi:hypothetical protein
MEAHGFCKLVLFPKHKIMMTNYAREPSNVEWFARKKIFCSETFALRQKTFCSETCCLFGVYAVREPFVQSVAFVTSVTCIVLSDVESE